MTIENTTDPYGNKLTNINMIDDGDTKHHAIPPQNSAGDDTASPDYITAQDAAELAGESVPWVHGMANKGRIETIGHKGRCVFNTVDVEALIQQKGRG